MMLATIRSLGRRRMIATASSVSIAHSSHISGASASDCYSTITARSIGISSKNFRYSHSNAPGLAMTTTREQLFISIPSRTTKMKTIVTSDNAETEEEETASSTPPPPTSSSSEGTNDGATATENNADAEATNDNDNDKANNNNELNQNLKPSEIVEALDRHIVGQHDAKRSVAIAMRNRWRRRQLSDDLRKEVTPRNVLLVGPTG